MNPSGLHKMIEHGENEKVEFKSSFNIETIKTLGRLPQNITIQDLRDNKYKSTPRNKLIADFFKSTGMIEKYGSGIQRIIHSFKEAGLPEPIFENISDGFQVIIKDQENETVEETVEETGKKVLEGMKNNDRITQRELMEETGLSRRGIEWNIAQLKEKGLIKRIGPTKGGYWEVVNINRGK